MRDRVQARPCPTQKRLLQREIPVERRNHPRVRCQCLIWLPGKLESVAGTVSNLSVGGCKVDSKASVFIGMYLAVQVCLPGQEATLKVDQAVVRWAREQEFGLEFISMWPEAEERLHRFVSTLEAWQSHSQQPSYCQGRSARATRHTR